jgi:hypothetical protein
MEYLKNLTNKTMKKQKTKDFIVNNTDLKSISRAEKIKTRLENKGYTLGNIQNLGFDLYKFIYIK